MKKYLPFIILLTPFFLSSCSAIETIFKAGMWWAFFLVAVVIIIIVIVASKLRKK